MRFPWTPKIEQRDSADYTGAVIDAAISAARGTGAAGNAAQVAAVVFGVGLLSRGFSTAAMSPEIQTFDPEMMARIVRSLLLTGNFIGTIYVSPVGGLRISPVVTWDITGGVSPSTWRYRVDMPSPGGRTLTRVVPAAGVIHVRLNTSLVQPWRGVSPLTEAGLSSTLLGNIEKRMGEEAGGRGGYLLPIPEGIAPEAMERLRTDLATLDGKIKIVETTTAGFGTGRAQGPLADWKPQRLGADVPAANVELRRDAANDVLAALGVPAALMSGAGAASREAWRHTIVTVLVPLARLVSSELTLKLERPVNITFPSLATVDIAARARAYGVLVGAGMEKEKAMMLAGLED